VSPITSCGIVTCDFVFVEFQHFQKLISFGYSQSHLVYDPIAFQASLDITEMLAYPLSVAFMDTCVAQAE